MFVQSKSCRSLQSREGGVVRALAAGIAAALIAVPLLGGGPAAAARHPVHRLRHAAPVDSRLVTGSIVIDADTGRVMSESNADAVTHPASLTKMMTLYLTFQAINSGRLRLDQYLPVSEYAASRPPTKLALRPGDAVPVRDLILGIVTRSANDAAVVLAEGLAGSEEAFAQRMNAEARRLGMSHTVFRNASGLPDPQQHTTAHDMAQLALALYHDFPREYRYFSTRQFDFRGTVIPNHDHLLTEYPGTDGIKTGYIRTSGFNLATSTVRDGHRLIGVVLGGVTARSRDREMMALLDSAFAQLGVGPVAQRSAPMPQPVAAAVPAAPTRRATPEAPALARTAARLASHLSPVTKAEAAALPAHHVPGRPVVARWGIQLGAFHAEGAARRVVRSAAGLPEVKGKPVRILASGKQRLYRAQLLDLTSKEAENACAALRKKNLPCSVIPPAQVRLATR
jgi:D-alanyl-D-alanine carboxypeptidase